MNNFLIDTHCHLYSEYYDNLDEIILNAKNNNVLLYINNGCNHKTNLEVIKLIDKYNNMYGTIGIHPEDIENYSDEDLIFIENNLKNEKIVAIGEIGLDYHYDKSNKDKQIELFERQLDMAQKYNIPVIVHSREATQDTIDVLKKYSVKGVIHSFSGSLEVANIYMAMGFKLGINGVITFKNSHLKDVIKEIDLNQIILETDAPYLTPHPYRGKKNEPKYIELIADFICELKNISKEELSTITTNNTKELFKKIT